MALIGESKNNGLFQRVTSEGSKYRELKYKDVSDTEPLIHGYHKSPIDFLPTEGIPGVTEEAGGAGIISDVTREVSTRIDDTARITKLLATSQGIKWEGHNVGLAAIESTLAKKRGQYIGGTDTEGGFWSMLLSVGQNLVNGLMGALDITGVTLSQVAVAGTGAHFSSFILANRSYLGKSAADEALHSGKVTFIPAEDKDVHITDGYRQLPGMVNEAVQDARKPKIRGTEIDSTPSRTNNPLDHLELDSDSEVLKDARKPKIKGTEIDSTGVSPNGKVHWSNENSSEEGFEYENYAESWKNRFFTDPSKTNPTNYLELDSNSEALKDARKPGLPGSKIETMGDPRTEYSRGGGWLPENSNSEEIPYEETKLEEETNGDNEGSIGRWIGDNKIDDEDLGEARQPSMAVGHGDVPIEPQHEDAPLVSWPLENSYDDKTKYLDQFSSSIYQVGFNPGAQVYSEDTVSGPWKHDGVHALVAGTAGSKNTNYQKDGGQTRNYGSTRNMPTESNFTRVDNGRIDMIPFWIRAITSDDTVNANAYLFFEANLDSYSDNYDASWESTQYIGRADKFWTYTGFDRQISFSFKMVAHTKSHLKPIYNRLNGLLSMCTPSYGSNDVFMQGVLAEITIGDLLSRQLGFIKSVGLKWETDYMWETDEGTIRVPHVLDVSVGFTPIHQFIPKLRKRYFELVGDGAAGVPTFIVQHNKLYKK